MAFSPRRETVEEVGLPPIRGPPCSADGAPSRRPIVHRPPTLTHPVGDRRGELRTAVLRPCDDAVRDADICFGLATRHGLDIHMLVDDTDDPNSRGLEYLAVKTMREGYYGRVAASHCGAMAAYHDIYAAKVIDMVATEGITISVNAHINLVCSARIDREPKRRGIARVREMLARGVNLVSSQGDVNDPYYPFGKPDQLEVALMLAHTAQLTLPTSWSRCSTWSPRMRRTPPASRTTASLRAGTPISW